MKKIVVGICGVLIVIGGVASLRSGALKAGELNKDSSAVIETETTESVSSISESSVPPIEEEAVENEVPTIDVEPETSVVESSRPEGQPVNPETSVSSEEIPSESSTSSTSPSSSTTVPSISSSTSSSSSNSSSTSNTGSTSSVKPTQPSTTTPSSTKPSVTKPSETTPSRGVPTPPSTSPSVGEPTQPVTPAPVPKVPESPAAATTVSPNVSSVQANPTFTTPVPEAFSETSTLNLPSELKTTEVAQSDLKGFELPLLSSLKEKAHGALIYEGIKQVGVEQEETYDVNQLAISLYKELYAIEPRGTPKKMPEELQIGTLLYKKEKDQTVLLGIYIGEDYYLSVDDVEVDEEATTTETEKETSETLTREKISKKDTNVKSKKKTRKSKKAKKQTPEESKTTDAEENEEKKTQRQVVVESIDLDEDLLVQEVSEVTLTKYGEGVLNDYPAAMNITENDGAKNFIEKVGEDAQKLGQEYDVFASVMIAQALLESGSGTSGLSLPPNHNLFGVKGAYQGQSVSMATQEDRGNGELYSINSAFRKYPNFAASLGDYVELLRGGILGNTNYYEKTWRSKAKNYLRTTDALTGTYATDTTYGKKLNSIIALYHLTQYDQPKVEKNSGVFIKGKDEIPEEYRSRMKYPDYNGVDYNASGSYPVGQCTWYAFNRVNQLGKTVDDYMGNGGQWASKGKSLGYEVSQKPKAGWLISFKPGVAGSDARYGHVAFVEVVRPEGILISEGNVYGGTIISYRVIDNNLATSDQVSYIKAK